MHGFLTWFDSDRQRTDHPGSSMDKDVKESWISMTKENGCVDYKEKEIDQDNLGWCIY